MKLTLTAGSFEDWYLIERAEHDGRRWLEPTDFGLRLMLSARISDADVEGTSAEMRALGKAIEARGRASFKRCAVRVEGDRVFFRSPRNSQTEGECSLAEADALAAEIRAAFPGGEA